MELLNAITQIFSGIGAWIIEQLALVQTLFWIEDAQAGHVQLTFLGVLAVAALGISIVFLLIRVIQNFLHFRG